jgi:thiol:disulfide interchange protein
VVPTIGLLVAIWFACWWIARTPATAEGLLRLRAWAEGALVIAVAWLFMFPGLKGFLPESIAPGGLASVMESRQQDDLEHGIAVFLEKQPAASAPAIAEATFTSTTDPPPLAASPKIVLVDFTANWCATCKTLEKLVLGTTEVREAVERNGVVMVHADWTHGEPEISKFMQYLGAKEVPVIAVFPPDRPNEPLVFRDGYTKRQILNALAQARVPKG